MATSKTKPRSATKPTPITEASPSSKAASTAARARWAGEKATESELREYFRTAPIDDCLVLLANMRKNAEMGAFEINQRMTETDQTKCKTCHKPKPPNRQWRLIRPRREPGGIVVNEFFCSDACVALENQTNQGTTAR